MKRPRVRFTVRRLMVAVAIVGMALGMLYRSARLDRTADYHAARAANSYAVSSGAAAPAGSLLMRDAWGAIVSAGRSRWHADLAEKYRRAARYPWLPVAPDPPEPE